MQNLKDSKTYFNLAKAFAGECLARTRYKFLEYGMRKGNLVAVADIIEKIIYNEFNHARMLYTFIESATEDTINNIDISSGYPFKEKWNMLDNLKFAAEDEASEAKIIYPEYAKIAEKEGFTDIAGLFNNLTSVEESHRRIFDELYQQLASNTLYKKPQKTLWRCGACGYEINDKEAPAECPLCQSKQGTFLVKISIII